MCWAAGVAAAGQARPAPRRLNINQARAAQLEKLPGIGPALARDIVAYREKNGLFRRVEELLIVRGMSRKKLDRLRPLITIDE